MQHMIDSPRSVVGVCLIALLAASGPAFASDHDDTPTLKAMPRHDARIADLHVFTRKHAGPGKGKHPRESLVLALSTNPTIPTSTSTYTFPSDLTLQILIDRNSKVDFTIDPVATATFGGTILDPAGISADIVFTVTFDASGTPQLATSGLDDDAQIALFAGLRDDPFIRGPRQGRNVASVVLELPLQQVAGGVPHHTLLVWAMSSVPGPTGWTGDLGARALRSQFAENMPLNDHANPADHYTLLHMTPDVVIFDTQRPAAFPNGRELIDDVVDMVGDPRILATDCPVPGDRLHCDPTENDVPFLPECTEPPQQPCGFPYLAPPQAAATGNPGVILHFGRDDD